MKMKGILFGVLSLLVGLWALWAITHANDLLDDVTHKRSSDSRRKSDWIDSAVAQRRAESPSPSVSVQEQNEPDQKVADHLTKDESRWRLTRPKARVYADKEKDLADARRYETEKQFTKLDRMGWEFRSFTFSTPVKAELLEKADSTGMAKIRHFSRIQNKTYDVWIFSKDLLPYDAEAYKRVVEEREARIVALISKRQKKSEWLGKSVEIAEKVLAFRDIDALWEFIAAIQSKKEPSSEQISDWAKNSRVILPGKGSKGFVVSTDEPYGYLQVESRIDGKEVRLWVLEKDLTEVQAAIGSEILPADPGNHQALPDTLHAGDPPSDLQSRLSTPTSTGADTMSDDEKAQLESQGVSTNLEAHMYPDENHGYYSTDVPKGQLEAEARGESSGDPSPEIPFTSTEKRIRPFQKFRLGDYTYEIKKCELRKLLGSEYSSTKPGAGAVFVIVRFTILNETKKTATVLSDDFTLRDEQGREFRPASKALNALTMEDENKDFLLSEVQPGIEKESITAFEVPKTALSGNLILIVPEKGEESKTVEVLLNGKKR